MKAYYTTRTFILLIVLHISSLLMAADNRPAVEQPLAQTVSGTLRGTKEGGISIWRGISYAQPPVGELRFRAPQPVQRWEGIKDASKFGLACPQTHRTASAKEQGEDCLYLNVWSPAADQKKRPVMVWIHGGGFLVGSGSGSLYDGTHLAQNGDVVVVSINYRLGALGFLYFDEIKGNKDGFDNNLGIRDQVAALKWVKDNIASFGGDPDQVTIFGESAGAISVMTLMSAPSAKGLFKRAIVESGVPESLWTPKTATEITLRYLKLVGLGPNDLDKLKALPSDTLVAGMDRLFAQLMKETTTVKVLAPTVDGSFLPHDLMTSIQSGAASGIDMMIGTNKDEATFLSLKKIGVTPRNAHELAPYLANVEVEARQKLVKAYKKYPHRSGVMDMTTDGVFVMPCIRFTEQQHRFASTYMYRFQWSSPLLRMTGLGSCHGLEMPFVFGNMDHGLGKFFTLGANRKTLHRISAKMQQSWLNFARYGSPSGESSNGDWVKYDPTHRYTMIFDKKSQVVSDPSDYYRKVWADYSIFK